jgi:hypothetical protein
MTYFNPYTDHSSTIQLNINGNSFKDENELFIDKFKSIFSSVYFTRLNIDCKTISVLMFVKIIDLLPNLDSLKVLSLPQIRSGWLSDNDEQTRFSTSFNNKITKVNFEKMIYIEQVHFLLKLCRCMEYFQIGVPNNICLAMLTRFILIQSNTYYPHFNSLCLSVSIADEEMIYQVQKLIESEKLLSNYNIKCIGNNILLKWNQF